MVDTPTTRNRFRKQEVGTNNNTWGTNLNQVLDCVDQVTDGYLAIALTTSSDYTLTTTNYTTADEAKNRVLKFTGTLSSAVEVIAPSVQHQYTTINASGVTLTFNTSAGSGVAIPNNRQCDVYSDASDFYCGSANWIPHYATSSFNNGDIMVYTTTSTLIATAIAAASISNTGQILISPSDTTSGYFQTKIIEGTGIDLTLGSLGSGSESVTISVDTTELDEFLAITGTLTSTFTSGTNAMTAKRRYRITGGTATIPTLSATDNFAILEMIPAAGTTVTAARNSQTINGTAADRTWTGTGRSGPVMQFSYISAGAVRAEIIGSCV